MIYTGLGKDSAKGRVEMAAMGQPQGGDLHVGK